MTTERQSRPWHPALPCHWAVAVLEPGANVTLCADALCTPFRKRRYGSNIFICLWLWKLFLSFRGILHTPAQAQAQARSGHAKATAAAARHFRPTERLKSKAPDTHET
ncbi:hypothetical protein LEMLEM_LOCUS21809 [Lemmus lemmus]